MRRSASIVLRRRRSVSWARQSEEPAVRAAWTLPPILVRNPRSKPILSPLPCSPYSTRAAAHTGRKRPEFAGFRACLLVRPSLSGIRAPSRFSAPSSAALILRGLWRMPAGNALNPRVSGHAFWERLATARGYRLMFVESWNCRIRAANGGRVSFAESSSGGSTRPASA